MELKDYTIEELRAEIKRRDALAKEQKKKELRCINCVHYVHHPTSYVNIYLCDVRTWGKTYPRHYRVEPYTKACDKFKNKFE